MLEARWDTHEQGGRSTQQLLSLRSADGRTPAGGAIQLWMMKRWARGMATAAGRTTFVNSPTSTIPRTPLAGSPGSLSSGTSELCLTAKEEMGRSFAILYRRERTLETPKQFARWWKGATSSRRLRASARYGRAQPRALARAKAGQPQADLPLSRWEPSPLYSCAMIYTSPQGRRTRCIDTRSKTNPRV